MVLLFLSLSIFRACQIKAQLVLRTSSPSGHRFIDIHKEKVVRHSNKKNWLTRQNFSSGHTKFPRDETVNAV